MFVSLIIIFLFIHSFHFIFIYLSIHIFIYIYLFIPLFHYLFSYLCIYFIIYLFACLFLWWSSLCLFIYFIIYLFYLFHNLVSYLFVYFLIYWFICLFVCLFFFIEVMSDLSIEKQKNNISFRFDYTSCWSCVHKHCTRIWCTFGGVYGVCHDWQFDFDRTFTMHWHVYAQGFLPVGRGSALHNCM